MERETEESVMAAGPTWMAGVDGTDVREGGLWDLAPPWLERAWQTWHPSPKTRVFTKSHSVHAVLGWTPALPSCFSGHMFPSFLRSQMSLNASILPT